MKILNTREEILIELQYAIQAKRQHLLSLADHSLNPSLGSSGPEENLRAQRYIDQIYILSDMYTRITGEYLNAYEVDHLPPEYN